MAGEDLNVKNYPKMNYTVWNERIGAEMQEVIDGILKTEYFETIFTFAEFSIVLKKARLEITDVLAFTVQIYRNYDAWGLCLISDGFSDFDPAKYADWFISRDLPCKEPGVHFMTDAETITEQWDALQATVFAMGWLPGLRLPYMTDDVGDANYDTWAQYRAQICGWCT